MSIVDELYVRFLDMERISPYLVMRYAKREYEFCVDIYDELKMMRIRNGIEKPRKKWERIK